MSITPMAGAQHVVSPLMRESLMDLGVLARTETTVRHILPHLNVVQIGGLSIMDRGQSAVMPLLDEIVANQAEHTQVIGVGPGVRARHILSVGLDLGLPTGALATLSAKSSAQNAYMVSCWRARDSFTLKRRSSYNYCPQCRRRAARCSMGFRRTTCESTRRLWAKSRRMAATRGPIWRGRCSGHAASS